MLRLQAISTESLDPHCLGAFEFVERDKNQKKKRKLLLLDKDTNESYVPRSENDSEYCARDLWRSKNNEINDK